MSAKEREFFAPALVGQSYGTPDEVDAALGGLVRRTAADEVLITTNTYDRADLLASYKALAELALPADARLYNNLAFGPIQGTGGSTARPISFASIWLAPVARIVSSTDCATAARSAHGRTSSPISRSA